jgi:parvulin-like peptidyl-prolyl isomerase
MAKNPQKPVIQNKKHLARLERERLQTRNIMIASAAVLVLVLGLILYGVLDQNVLQGRRPVAVVNGQAISADAYEQQVRYGRYSLIQNAQQTYQFMQMFGSDPSTQSQFVGQLQQINQQLSPELVGQSVLDQMVDDVLIRQEVKRRGITVSEAEVQAAFERAFGYFPNGTPTPTATLAMRPTSTLSALQLTALPPTPTEIVFPTETVSDTAALTATVVPTDTETAATTPEPTAEPTALPEPTEVLTPTATATPYTAEGYQQVYQETVKNFKDTYNIDEAALRYLIETEVYRDKLRTAVLADANLTNAEEQVWARHILVADEATAKTVIERLNAGEDFAALAAELSTDTSNKDKGGDLGWFGRGRMVAPFEEAAFALEVGEISAPIESQFGWHVIQVLGHEERPLDETAYQALQDKTFSDFLTSLKEAATIDQKADWLARVPLEPTMPAEILDLMAQLAAQQAQPPQPELPTLPTEAPAAVTPAP